MLNHMIADNGSLWEWLVAAGYESAIFPFCLVILWEYDYPSILERCCVERENEAFDCPNPGEHDCFGSEIARPQNVFLKMATFLLHRKMKTVLWLSIWVKSWFCIGCNRRDCFPIKFCREQLRCSCDTVGAERVGPSVCRQHDLDADLCGLRLWTGRWALRPWLAPAWVSVAIHLFWRALNMSDCVQTDCAPPRVYGHVHCQTPSDEAEKPSYTHTHIKKKKKKTLHMVHWAFIMLIVLRCWDTAGNCWQGVWYGACISALMDMRIWTTMRVISDA